MCEVDVFVLHVNGRLDDWPEKGQRREIAFMPPEQAAGLVQESSLRRIILSVGNLRKAGP